MARKYITVSSDNDAWGAVPDGFDSTKEARKIAAAAREYGIDVYFDENPPFDARQDDEQVEWWAVWCEEGYQWDDKTWNEWFSGHAMTAQDFADSLSHPVVWFAGVGCPSGQAIALLESTELPFVLSDLIGSVEHEIFEAHNLEDEFGWKFVDWQLNTIYKIQVFDDEKIWQKQHDDLD